MIDDLVLDEAILDEEADGPDPLGSFLAEGLITEVLGELKSGKEGTVYVCRAHPSLGTPLAAAKVYRSREHRAFHNDTVYREGVVILNKRDARAMKRKSSHGQSVAQGTWMYHEFETLRALHDAGADVPRPLRMNESAVLMEYIGDEETAAPKLQEVSLQPEEVRPLFARMLNNIELLLRMDLIHGDLSPYNVLYWQGNLILIDFPQTIDPRSNPNALPLLQRDIENICRYWSRYGVKSDPARMAQYLWQRYLRSEL